MGGGIVGKSGLTEPGDGEHAEKDSSNDVGIHLAVFAAFHSSLKEGFGYVSHFFDAL